MTSPDTRTAGKPGHARGFRPDIEGLRAVAIGLVLVYHAGVKQLPGGFVGVDVFFVISGFLITGLLIRELERNGRISLSNFYARRAKRLLPAAALVLAVTALLTWLTSAVTSWRTFGLDIVAASTYVVNWVLAGRSVDYLAEDVDVSPVQHFWSLAVEEQFYIVWPLLLVLVGLYLRRRSGARLRPVLAAAICLVVVPSFVWSVVMTAASPQQAFFVTTTRLWELGIGALVAIGSTLWARLPRLAAAVLGWLGLGVVAASGLLLTSESAWPGYLALAPTLGTAAVIVAGFTAGRAGPGALLSWRPAVWVGGLSYSLYLWHWPLWVAATAQWGELGAKKGLLVMAASFVPAYVSHRLVENPVRFSPAVAASTRLALSLGLNFSLLGVVSGLVLVNAVGGGSSAPAGQEASGGGAIVSGDHGSGPVPGTLEGLAEETWWVPDATEATKDLPELYDQGCQVDQDSPEPIPCEWGDPHGEVVVAAVGDSKIAQWMSALDAIGEEQGWRIVSHTKSACVFSEAVQVNDGKPYTSCSQWNEKVKQELVELDPDVVLTSHSAHLALWSEQDPTDSRNEEAMTEGVVSAWSYLAEHGIPVVAILDNPDPRMSVYECVAEHPDDLAACTFDRDAGVAHSGRPAQLEAAERVPGARTVDTLDLICPTDTCVPVIGNVLVYRQTSHITDTYARSLTEPLAERLVPEVEAAVGEG